MHTDFHIARWHVQPQRNRIDGADTSAQLEPKIMRVLVYLAERAGDVVAREEILDAVWPDVVVGDEVVSRSISELRKVFGDNPRAPEVIETIPKSGYRLMVPVSYAEAGGDHVPMPSVQVAPHELAGSPPARSSHRWRYGVFGAVLALALLGAGAWLLRSPHATPEPTRLVQTTPLTASPGFEFAPALSPDGRQAAFIWTGGPQKGPLNLYTKLVGGEPLQLTDSRLYEWSPTWNPDGREIAFARSLHGLFVVPALGGPERKLTDIGRTSRPELDWSPLGDVIAFTDRASAESPYRIHLYAFETGATEPLTDPPTSFHGDTAPAFSPDGRQIAFARVSDRASDLYVLPVRDGSAQRLTTDHGLIAGVTWTPDGRHLIFSSNRGGTYGLWRIDVGGGEPVPVSLSGLGDLRDPVLRGGMLAYTESYADVNIWQYSLADTTAAPTPWLASSRWDANPQFAPDGRRVAFASARSGYPEIWVADRAGTEALQLTAFEGPHTGHPRWSPDGEHLAFDSREAGNADIYSVASRGGVAQRLTTDPARDLLPSWSRDGRWIYFTSNRSGTWQVWKIPATGGPAIAVTRRGGYAATEDPDRASLYYTRPDTSGLWRASLGGSEQTFVVEPVERRDWKHWSVTAEGVYFLHATSHDLYRYDPATGQSTLVRAFAHDPSWSPQAIAIDPDRSRLLATQTDRSYYDIIVMPYEP